ncbi:hypothetical protein NPS29_00335 [Pseudomonas putida]|uniref:hypothetical protein n=1 Tax=Pseudomonas putida TaxID=303 RepID=UPI002363DD84|nr:hypothetical protein [Pseudomonas putida]MDD1963758.1 hypothetical protein [Pseudomonas putida]
MSEPKFYVFLIDTPYGEAIGFRPGTHRQESHQLSAFQALGLELLRMDTIIEKFPVYTRLAIGNFVRHLINDGWPDELALGLLGSQDWKIRMYHVWCAMGEDERKKSIALNYHVYENYWPTLDFSRQDFTIEIEKWIAEKMAVAKGKKETLCTVH